MTLQCEPAFALAAAEAPARLDDVLADLDTLITTNDHFEFYWFPHTRRVLTKRNNRVLPGTALHPIGRRARLRRRRTAVEHRLRRAEQAHHPPSRDDPAPQRGGRAGPHRPRLHRPQLPGVRLAAAGRVPRDGVRGPARGRPGAARPGSTGGSPRPGTRRLPRRGALRGGRRLLAVDRLRTRHRLRRGAPVPPPRPRGLLPGGRSDRARPGRTAALGQAPLPRRGVAGGAATRASATSSRCATASIPDGCSATTTSTRVLGA